MNPKTVAILPVLDLNMPLTMSLVWRRDNTSPLLARFMKDVRCYAQPLAVVRRFDTSPRAPTIAKLLNETLFTSLAQARVVHARTLDSNGRHLPSSPSRSIRFGAFIPRKATDCSWFVPGRVLAKTGKKP